MYDHVRTKTNSDRDFDLERFRRTLNNISIDNLSRPSCNGTNSVVGRDPGMQAAGRRHNSDECFNCRKIDTRLDNCPEVQRRRQPQLHKQKTNQGKKSG